MEKTDYEINEIPPSIWQNMKECIALLASPTTLTETKNQVGEQLLQQISYFQNKSMFKINQETTTSRQQIDHMQTTIHRLRDQVYSTQDTVETIMDGLKRIDGNNQSLNDRITIVESKLQQMENVNCNFRKILKLENDFLRELSRMDNETITRLHKRLHLLRTKLETITGQTCAGSIKSLALTGETRYDEFEEIGSSIENAKLDVQPKSSNVITATPFVIGITELMSRGFTKDNVLELFRGLRNPEMND